MKFGKRERIVSQKLIDGLFGGSNQSLVAFPLRIVYLYKERAKDEPPVQVLMSVPKKRFKHAVDRNRVKRQLREAYRRHKDIVESMLGEEEGVAIAFVWLTDRHAPSAVVDQRVATLLEKMAKKVKSEVR